MRKMIMDFAPPQWCLQTTASPSHLSKNHAILKPRYAGHRHPTILHVTMAACLLTQIFSCASLAKAYQEFDLIDGATPACTDCADNNSAPALGQTRVTMQDAYGLGYYPRVEQVSYDAEHPSHHFGQPLVSEMPVVQYSSDPTYASYNAVPSVSQPQSYNSTYTSSASSSENVQPGLAQQKAVQAAQSGLRGHLGGGLGGAKYEGVGWSNHSAQNAINSCCYWGTRPTAQIGVSKGNDGFWYACVLYY